MSTYCDVAPGHEWHGPYHESHYGYPIADDDELFERLILEINQAASAGSPSSSAKRRSERRSATSRSRRWRASAPAMWSG